MGAAEGLVSVSLNKKHRKLTAAQLRFQASRSHGWQWSWLKETTDTQVPAGRNYCLRNAMKHLNPLEEAGVRLLGKLRHLNPAGIAQRLNIDL